MFPVLYPWERGHLGRMEGFHMFADWKSTIPEENKRCFNDFFALSGGSEKPKP